MKEKIISVHLNINNKYNENQIDDIVNEMKELVRASNSVFVGSVVQNQSSINPTYFIGSGKAKELKEISENLEADCLVFDCELSGSQMRNLENIINKKIIDRTDLILDIFARRAKTKESKLQIKLAQLQYRLPRLIGFRNYLSREGAGVGARGPGEQKLELDRRSILREISSIKTKLKDIDKKRDVERKRRNKSQIPKVTLIGYSNVGKSTILNAITRKYSHNNKNLYSDDMLFATLDTSARNVVLDNEKEVIISDTVGFISNLPTKLIESFKSTLEEVKDSDLILLVIDASDENYKMQLDTTLEIINDIKSEYTQVLYVFNKIDKNEDFRVYNKYNNHIYISAKDDKDIEFLVEKIENIVFNDYISLDVFVKYTEYDKIRKLVLTRDLRNEKYLEEGIQTTIYLKKDDIDKYREYIEYDK